jgi:hypothetical protein
MRNSVSVARAVRRWRACDTRTRLWPTNARGRSRASEPLTPCALCAAPGPSRTVQFGSVAETPRATEGSMSDNTVTVMFEKCPVCRRFTHANDCPVRDIMALEWAGKSPDHRQRENIA